jgi:putative SOS response-associated peptidase YedK
MCGRFSLAASGETIRDLFQLTEVPVMEGHYNVAPTQPVAVVRLKPDGAGRRLDRLRWGLIPNWCPELPQAAPLINARAETAAEKPAFRIPFRQRRCLVPADGFYEWQKQGDRKQPYCIRLKDGKPFAFAGLWDAWRTPENEVLESCTILTTDANDLLRPVHDRMPVILQPRDFDRWLDTRLQNPEDVQSLLRPFAAESMTAFRISSYVNSTKNEGPKCIEPLAVGPAVPPAPPEGVLPFMQ